MVEIWESNIPLIKDTKRRKGELDAHFEPQIEVQSKAWREVYESISFFRRQFPTIFMTPAEIVKHLEVVRWRVDEIEKQIT